MILSVSFCHIHFQLKNENKLTKNQNNNNLMFGSSNKENNRFSKEVLKRILETNGIVYKKIENCGLVETSQQRK